MRFGSISKLAIFVSVMFGVDAQAEFFDCGLHNLERIIVQGTREDNHAHQNMLVIGISGEQCNNRSNVYIRNDHPAYASMLSIALAAKAQKKPLRVYVNTNAVVGSATELAILLDESS